MLQIAVPRTGAGAVARPMKGRAVEPRAFVVLLLAAAGSRVALVSRRGTVVVVGEGERGRGGAQETPALFCRGRVGVGGWDGGGTGWIEGYLP